MFRLEERVFWKYLHPDLRELFLESEFLLEAAKNWVGRFHDFGFVVFPAAKGFEGFLKTVFYDLGLIDKQAFLGEKFRVGKSLNPELESGLREQEGVYDKLVSFCNGREVPDTLWRCWKRARNLVFHWFPNERNAISLEEAEERLEEIFSAMELLFRSCNFSRRSKQ